MGELKDLYQAEIDKGVSIRHLSLKTGINANTLYSFCKTQYGKQLPTKENYKKLNDYFGEEILINSETLIYPINQERALRFKSIEERKKFQQVLNILECNERTIIPNCYVDNEQRLLEYLEAMGINAKYWYVDYNGYLERVYDQVNKGSEEKLETVEENLLEDEEMIEDNETVEVITDEEKLSVDNEIVEMVNYLIEKSKDKLINSYSEQMKSIHALKEMDPIEALKIIRENRLI